LRDSQATGTDYGRFDLEWLLQHLRVNVEKGRFYLSHKALFAAENYVFARFHMYRTVYFHKTTRAGEVMLRLLFKRYKRLLEDATTPDARRIVAPNAPPHVALAFSGEGGRMTLTEYLSLDDHSITEFLKCCLQAKDTQLRDLSGGLLFRNLYKATDATHADPASVGAFNHAAIERVEELGYDPGFAFFYDSPSDTPYKPYDPDAERPATQIYVETHSGGVAQELGTVLEAVQQLKRRYRLLRYYYPSEIRKELDEVAQTHLTR
jgi:HD superfamily phosphohydrolase